MANETKKAVAELVTEALKQVAKDPSNTMKERDVAPAAKAVTDNVTAAVQHATNTEDHWWQKRSFWSAIVSGVVVVAAPIALRYGIEVGEEEKELIVGGLTTIGGLVASYLAYRAGTAKKPLGQ